MTDVAPPAASRTPHFAALLTVCATFPLLFVGGLVTTTQAGMAVPDWPTTYGYNLFLYPWQTWLFGPWDLFVEHGHRLLGAAVGLLTIGCLACTWRDERRRWVRWYAVALLAAVILQGVLGGMRVRLDARDFARIHACVGPLFFALATGLAVVTSRWWQSPTGPAIASSRLVRLAGLTTFLAYLQIVLGAQLRHVAVDASPRFFAGAVLFHLAVAVALFAHGTFLAIRVYRLPGYERALRRPTLALALLLCFQIGLGVATWGLKYGWPAWLVDAGLAPHYSLTAASAAQVLVATAHVATGSLILATSLVVALRSGRLWRPAPLAAAAAPIVFAGAAA